MLTTTLRNMLIFEKNRIYIVKGILDGNEQVIYVGKAGRQSVAERLMMHLRGNEKGRQRFGDMLLTEDSSPEWKVEVWTIEECGQHFGKTFASIDGAERAMINWLKPIANKRV